MDRLLFSFALFVALLAGSWLVHVHYGLSLADTAALAALLGAAAAVAALSASGSERSRCQVSNLYVSAGGQDRITFHIEAHVLNKSSQADTLQAVRYVFYHRRTGAFPLLLIFGAREITHARGQILPCPLAPGQTYMVEAKDHFDSESPRGKRLAQEMSEPGVFLIRCKFIFDRCRPIVCRIEPFKFSLAPRLKNWLNERRMHLHWDNTVS